MTTLPGMLLCRTWMSVSIPPTVPVTVTGHGKPNCGSENMTRCVYGNDVLPGWK